LFAKLEASGQTSRLNVFVKRDGNISPSLATAMAFGTADPGRNQRHADTIWPLRSLFDLTPEGRGTTRFPKLAY